jgi:hypothetical protein
VYALKPMPMKTYGATRLRGCFGVLWMQHVAVMASLLERLAHCSSAPHDIDPWNGERGRDGVLWGAACESLPPDLRGLHL